ncbi:mCG146949 [Mus musculus]|jgi:hypothetical protein|nr:mCG146949 [Mus musculus]
MLLGASFSSLSCEVGALYSESLHSILGSRKHSFKVLFFFFSLTPENILTNSQQGAYVFVHRFAHTMKDPGFASLGSLL